MARILIIILLLFGNGLISSQSVKNGIQVLEGDLLNTGHLLRTDKQVFRVQTGVLQEELAYLAGKKIRMLCDVQGEACNPIRYEMEPFETGKTPDWSLKKSHVM